MLHGGFVDGIAKTEGQMAGEPIKRQVNNRRGVERQNLAENQAAHDSYAERATKLRTDAVTKCERQAAEKRRHGGHHDGTKAQEAGFVNGIERRLPFLAFGLESEVDHHNGVFLDNADQENDADEGNDAELSVADQESKNRADAGGRERGKNSDGVNETFIQNAENDVHSDQRSEDQDGFVAKRATESCSRTLESGLTAGWQSEIGLGAIDGVHGIAERSAGSKIE